MKFKITFSNPKEFYEVIQSIPDEFLYMKMVGAVAVWYRWRPYGQEYVIISPRGARIRVSGYYKFLGCSHALYNAYSKEKDKLDEERKQRKEQQKIERREFWKEYRKHQKEAEKAKRAEGAAKAKAAAEAKKAKK
jgi:hypothetical protein